MNFTEELAKSKLVLVDFFATWCGPCKMLAPIIEELKEELKGEVYVISVDVDEEMEIAEKFKIYSIPTLMLFSDGVLKDTMVGYAPKDKVLDFINRNK